MSTRLAPLSLDLDSKWSYLKTHGDESWKEFPSYYDIVVPRVLSVLEDLELKITFFVVGKDAEASEHRPHLESIRAAGHGIGNHSYMHEPWLHLYDRETLRNDLERSHKAIANATGVEPRGFRGPGFSLSNETLEELSAMGYTYDATIFPNLLNPLSRAYYFWKSDLTPDERRQRKALFGTLSDAVRPNLPFKWSMDGRRLIEVPVTTLPGLRLPFHFSYLIYLAGVSETVALTYLRAALRLCRIRGTGPSLLLHPLDFLGREDDGELGFFPGMSLAADRKIAFLRRCIGVLREHYNLVPFDEYLAGLSVGRLRVPDLPAPGPSDLAFKPS